MSNLKHCTGCNRDLPLSMFPRRKDHCFHCVFNGPGEDKEDVLNVEKNLPKMDEELTYVKHEQELKTLLKEYPGGLSTKQIAMYLEITRDAAYALCTSLHDENKLGMVKEQRGAGRAQNIYYLPALDKLEPMTGHSSYMKSMEDEPKLIMNSDEERQHLEQSITASLRQQPSWDELKNRLIKDGDCGTALKIMVTMEEEATL